MKTTQAQLFPDPPKPQRSAPRVMMKFTDCGDGHPNWARFACHKCGHKEESHTVPWSELTRGRPCPKCNQ